MCTRPQCLPGNGPLANMPEFAKAFGCQPGDSMVRLDSVRVTIW
jgi:putative endopeptidase